MRVLITGHNGYIGSVMAPFIQNAGHAVTGLDAFWYEAGVFGSDPWSIPSLHKDIRQVTEADLEGYDAVVHLAALCNDPLGDLNPELTREINHLGTISLAKKARTAGVRRFLFASSCSLYGAARSDDILTESAPMRPVTVYAESKVRAEADLSRLADRHFSPVFLRNATAYGLSPRLRADIVLNNLAGWAHTTGRIRILSDGKAWRPIVHVEDIARAFLAVLEAPRDIIHNECFNVGADGENYQVLQLADFVRQASPRCRIDVAGVAGHDPRNYRVDFTKLARTLPTAVPRWNAQRGAVELCEGLRRVGLEMSDFQGPRYVRVAALKDLMVRGVLDKALYRRKEPCPCP